jgi:ADP-ribose pyrophosphatase
MRPPSGYQRLERREIYRNPWLAVEVHRIVHPTGAPGEHVAIATGHASGVLVEEGSAFLFAHQPRFAACIETIEIVKGGADEGESALACAKRELREELGLEAETWIDLGIAYEVPSIIEHPVTLYLARDVREVGTDLEAVEQIAPVRFEADEAYRAAADGRINDAVTLAALFRYRLIASG